MARSAAGRVELLRDHADQDQNRRADNRTTLPASRPSDPVIRYMCLLRRGRSRLSATRVTHGRRFTCPRCDFCGLSVIYSEWTGPGASGDDILPGGFGSRPIQGVRGMGSLGSRHSGVMSGFMLRNLTTGIMKRAGHHNIAATRRYAGDATRSLATSGISPA